eukprot:15442255-Alexandrium_andersonii.AAC.1
MSARRVLAGLRSRASPGASSRARGACAACRGRIRGPPSARASTPTLRVACAPAGPRAEGCARGKTIALSSGEAELAGIAKGAAEGLGLLAVAHDRGLSASLQVYADSSAAIGMRRRAGVGRVRRLAAGRL